MHITSREVSAIFHLTTRSFIKRQKKNILLYLYLFWPEFRLFWTVIRFGSWITNRCLCLTPSGSSFSYRRSGYFVVLYRLKWIFLYEQGFSITRSPPPPFLSNEQVTTATRNDPIMFALSVHCISETTLALQVWLRHTYTKPLRCSSLQRLRVMFIVFVEWWFSISWTHVF